jgi:hypothetical protein
MPYGLTIVDGNWHPPWRGDDRSAGAGEEFRRDTAAPGLVVETEGCAR